MRNQKQNVRLQHARGQMFVCGMFGNCANAVLSPRTPPGLQDFGRKATVVWAANEGGLQQQQQQQRMVQGTSLLDSQTLPDVVHLSDPSPSSPSVSDADNATSSSASETANYAPADQEEAPSEGRLSTSSSSAAAAGSKDNRQMYFDELLSAIKAGEYSESTFIRLLDLANESEMCKEQLRSSGVVSSLISFLLSKLDCERSPTPLDETKNGGIPFREKGFAELERLSDEDSAMILVATPEMLSLVVWHLRKGSKDSKEKAAQLLEKLSLVESFKITMGSCSPVLEEIVSLLRQEKQPRLVKLATKTLLALCLVKENRCRAVEAGAVAALLEMLPMVKPATGEKALATLELLTTIDEGKMSVSAHALAVPILVDMILRVSDRGTEYAAGALHAICGDNIAIQEAAVAAGAPTKLLLLIQSDCTARAKRKALQLLKVLHKLWGEDPCNPDAGHTKAIHY
ncbi:unnamed protein product [Sphagnum compactum]